MIGIPTPICGEVLFSICMILLLSLIWGVHSQHWAKKKHPDWSEEKLNKLALDAMLSLVLLLLLIEGIYWGLRLWQPWRALL